MKTLLSISVPTFALLLAGAWNFGDIRESHASSRSDAPNALPSAGLAAKTPKMWTNTATLYKGEALVLEFAAPNAPFLGVIDPSGHFFYVVFPREMTAGKLTPLVDSERFASMPVLKIDTRQFKADPYTYGVDQNQAVFTQTGTYTFILGENLHVDDPDFVDKVTVHYTHARRPADVAMNY